MLTAQDEPRSWSTSYTRSWKSLRNFILAASFRWTDIWSDRWAKQPGRRASPPILDCWAAATPANVATDNIDRFVSQPRLTRSARSRGSDLSIDRWRTPSNSGQPGNGCPLVALMRQHGTATIWSHDRDLRKRDHGSRSPRRLLVCRARLATATVWLNPRVRNST